MCDRIGIIDHGRIVALDTPHNLKDGLGGDLIDVKAPATKVEALRALEYVKRVEVANGHIALTVRNAAVHLPQILAMLEGVESVEVRLPTLDDVFLKYTGRKIREEENEAGWADAALRYSQGGR